MLYNHWATGGSMVSKGRCFPQNLRLITLTQLKFSVHSLLNLQEPPFCLSVQPACHLVQIQHLQLLLKRPLKRIAISPIVSELCPQTWESGCLSQNSCFCLLHMFTSKISWNGLYFVDIGELGGHIHYLKHSSWYIHGTCISHYVCCKVVNRFLIFQ